MVWFVLGHSGQRTSVKCWDSMDLQSRGHSALQITCGFFVFCFCFCFFVFCFVLFLFFCFCLFGFFCFCLVDVIIEPTVSTCMTCEGWCLSSLPSTSPPKPSQLWRESGTHLLQGEQREKRVFQSHLILSRFQSGDHPISTIFTFQINFP